MKGMSGRNVLEEIIPIQGKPARNPLFRGIQKIIGRVTEFKEMARMFYFEVILSVHPCPKCGGRLKMTGLNECACSCGYTFDPTLAFQKSTCCEAKLVLKTFHYACSRCHKTVASRFIFDERVFDKEYFREMMREARKSAKRKREEIRLLLAESRSGVLPITEEPDLDSIPGLLQDLDDFILQSEDMRQHAFDIENNFCMDDYRAHILSGLTRDRMLFSDIAPLIADSRCDRIRRFITLIFMDNEHEIELTQADNDIWVRRRAQDETYAQG